jgi:hypothetical protein
VNKTVRNVSPPYSHIQYHTKPDQAQRPVVGVVYVRGEVDDIADMMMTKYVRADQWFCHRLDTFYAYMTTYSTSNGTAT